MKASHRAYALLILLFVLSFGFRMQTIGGVAPKAVQAGAYPGDTLLEFNGRPFTGCGTDDRAAYGGGCVHAGRAAARRYDASHIEGGRIIVPRQAEL